MHHASMIVSIHALTDVKLLQQRFVSVAGELTALIGVQNARNAMGCYSILDRLDHIDGIQRVGQVPANDHTAVPVDDGGQVHMAVLHFDVSNVDGPDLIWKKNILVSE